MGRIDRCSYTRIFKEIYIKLLLNICVFNNKTKFLYKVVLLLNICVFNNKTKFLYKVVLLSYFFSCTFLWIVFTSRYEMQMGQIFMCWFQHKR